MAGLISTAGGTAPAPLGAAALRRFCVALFFAEASSSFGTSMIFSALGAMYREFADPVGVGWLLTAFLLVYAGVAVIGGRLGDIYGRRTVLIAALGLAVFGSLLSAIAHDLIWIAVGRAIQGVAGTVLPLCFGLVRDHFASEKVAFGVGLVAAAAGFTSGLGMVIGGLLVDHGSWRWIFWLNTAVALLGVVLVLFWIPRAVVTRRAKFDWIGAILFVPALTGLLLAITNLKSWGWNDERTIIVIGCSVAAIVYWCRHEWRHPDALIDIRALSNRQIAVTNLVSLLTGLGTMQAAMLFMLLLQQPSWTGVGLGVSATLSGILKLPSNFLGAAGSVIGGWISSRFNSALALSAGLLLICVGWVGLLEFIDHLWIVVVMMTIAGCGNAIGLAAMPNLIIEVTPSGRTSEALGVTQVIRSTGMAIGTFVISMLLASSTVHDAAMASGSFPTRAAHQNAIWFVIATSLISLFAAIFMARILVRAHHNEVVRV